MVEEKLKLNCYVDVDILIIVIDMGDRYNMPEPRVPFKQNYEQMHCERFVSCHTQLLNKQ